MMAAASAEPQRSRSRLLAPFEVAEGVLPCCTSSFSSWTRSAALCQRSSGLLARQILTTSSNRGGESFCSDDTGGGLVWSTAPITVAGRVPGNARPPRQPSRAASRQRRRCRSARWRRDRRVARAPYRDRCRGPRARCGQWHVARGEGRQEAGPEVASSFERPKSSSFAPDLVNITLPGLMSRWTMPARCALSRAPAISRGIPRRLLASAADRARAASVCPSRYSITR